MSDNRIYNPYQPITPNIGTTRPASSRNPIGTNKPDSSISFNQLLEQEVSGIKFSQHAMQRLNSRKIQLDSGQLNKLNQAMDKAAQKGAKDALILMNNNLAFVVSVKNKTVITAMDGASIKDNVFTNIDSAVII